MGFRCGIIGLPNVGKSTIFNALTAAGADVANYPFCTIDPNVGVVRVPDRRLDFISSILKPPKTTPTVMQFLDIAGLVRGASRGEGLGNKFLGHIRDVEAVVHIVRCFDSPDVVHIYGPVDPARDVEIINMELALADLETVERRIERINRQAKAGDKVKQRELAFCEAIRQALSEGTLVRNLEIDPGDREILEELHLLTDKKVLYVANVSEEVLKGRGGYIDSLAAIAEREGSEVIPICGDLESEIVLLDESERTEFLADLGLEESGLEHLIHAGYRLLDLITFYTTAGQELRAWTVRKGTKAPEAAGKIHTDMEKGFIRAEVVGFHEFQSLGSMTAAREKGLVRSEGRDYIIHDGDIIYFRFNV